MKIGINGLGRIGRLALRASIERKDVEIVALNTSASADQLAHLIKYDSTHGRAPFEVSASNNLLKINDLEIPILNCKQTSQIPWPTNTDIVLECSGRLNTKELAAQHRVKKVLVSSPCKNVDATIVLGVNQNLLSQGMQVISVGSCTTNALAPIAKILHEDFDIQAGYVTTVHAYTFDQNLLDNFHEDIRRSRSATTSMIPTKSGISSALQQVLPELSTRITGSAIRVPVPNVSLIDFSFTSSKPITKQAINNAIAQRAATSMKGIVAIAQDQQVSIDFNHTTFSSILDPFETNTVGEYFARVLAWYDNEWAFVNRMIDVAKLFSRC